MEWLSWLCSNYVDEFRGFANEYLSKYEPLVLVIFPVLSLVLALFLHSLLGVISDKGLKPTLLGFFMSFLKYLFLFSSN